MAAVDGTTTLPRLRAPLAAVLLAATAAAWGQASSDYALQAGDQVEISVWGEEEMQRTLLIRPDGKFSFPLTGEITAAGRTPSAIQAELAQKLEAFIPEAAVTVSVTGLQGNQVYVIGQVTRPGALVMNPTLNVLQALSMAGGTTPFAALNDIIVIRGRGENQRVFPFGYDEIKRGRRLDQNIELMSGDVVLVP